MEAQPIQHLSQLIKGQTFDAEVWRRAAHALADKLLPLLPLQPSGRDAAPSVSDGTGFNLWLWSEDSAGKLPVEWSCIIGGGINATNEGYERFSVSASLFLFDGKSNARLKTADERSFVAFTFSFESGEWVCDGWMIDEFGEWEDLGLRSAQCDRERPRLTQTDGGGEPR